MAFLFYSQVTISQDLTISELSEASFKSIFNYSGKDYENDGETYVKGSMFQLFPGVLTGYENIFLGENYIYTKNITLGFSRDLIKIYKATRIRLNFEVSWFAVDVINDLYSIYGINVKSRLFHPPPYYLLQLWTGERLRANYAKLSYGISLPILFTKFSTHTLNLNAESYLDFNNNAFGLQVSYKYSFPLWNISCGYYLISPKFNARFNYTNRLGEEWRNENESLLNPDFYDPLNENYTSTWLDAERIPLRIWNNNFFLNIEIQLAAFRNHRKTTKAQKTQPKNPLTF